MTRCKFTAESNNKNIFKIGQHLSKLWTITEWHVFMAHSVYDKPQHDDSLHVYLQNVSAVMSRRGIRYAPFHGSVNFRISFALY